MADFTSVIRTIRQAAVDEIEKNKPVTTVFGKVKSVDPFEMVVDQQLTLTEEFIVIGQYVREYSVDFTIKGEMWHGFRIGDELILSRLQGGAKYIIIDFLKRVDEDTRPAWIMTGEVVSDAPNIKINDYLTLTPDQLILCRNVTEYYVDMSVSHNTELETEHIHPVIDTYTGGGTSRPTQHLHEYKNRKKFLVHNGLVVGDKVLLACERVTQKWYVIDFIQRMDSAVRGEWI